MNDILALSLLILLGYISGRVMEFIKLPALTGYILVGFLLGPSISNVIGISTIEKFDFIGLIALGLIAFIIGSKIEIRALKELKENFIFITVFQALVTFALVSVGVYFFICSLPIALILGAISSATAPAAVFGVIEEYKAKGPLTSTLLAVVAIDDALCLLLFGGVTAVVTIITGVGAGDVWHVINFTLFELFGSLAVGAIIGYSIDYIIGKAQDIHKVIYITIGLVLLGCGLSIKFGLSELLTNMVAGFVIVNTSNRGKELFGFTEKAEEPILILFFALAGSQLQIDAIHKTWILVLIYVCMRWIGKIFGGMLGAWLSKAPKVVQKYVGLGLVPQAGVAIGLIYIVKEKMPEIAAVVIAVVLTSTFINEIIGPIGVEIALLKSKEGKRP